MALAPGCLLLLGLLLLTNLYTATAEESFGQNSNKCLVFLPGKKKKKCLGQNENCHGQNIFCPNLKIFSNAKNFMFACERDGI